MRAGEHHAATAASTSRWATSAPTTCGAQFKGMVERCADCGFDLAGGRVEVVPTAHYMMGGVEFAPDCTTERRGALRRRARTRAACTARTASAATASPTRRCSAASPATRWRAWLARERRVARARSRRRSRRARRARRAPFARRRGDARSTRFASALYDVMWDDVGIVRDAAGLRARARTRSSELRASSARTGARGDATRAFNLTWHDWLNLENLIAVSRRSRAPRWRARIRAARTSARTSRAVPISPLRRSRESVSGGTASRSSSSRSSSPACGRARAC